MRKATLPDFLVIGAEKAGSSWLWRNLSAHPEIFMPLTKEIHFFNKTRNWERGPSWYARFFADAPPGTVRGEATPGYLYSEEAPSRIRELLPNAKLIVSLRDPVERAFSAYRMAISKLHIPPCPFETALDRYPFLIRNSLYSEALARYFQFFPRENMRILLFHEMMAHRPKTLAELYRFLGVQDCFEPPGLERRHAPSRDTRSSALNAAILGIAAFLRQIGIGGLVRIAKRAGIRALVFRLNSKVVRKYEGPPPAVERELRASLLWDIEATENLVGRSLQCWKR